jgi:hypothetical protein
MGSMQSMAAGISLDASNPAQNQRVLYMVSPSYSGDQFAQLTGRVSRRNSVKPAMVLVMYAADMDSDIARQGKVSSKTGLLQVSQGYGLGEDYRERLENQTIAPVKGAKERKPSNPFIEDISPKAFVVKDSYDIKEQLQKLGAKYNKKAGGWMFPMSRKAEIQAVLDNNQAVSDNLKKGNQEGASKAIHSLEQTENNTYYSGRFDYDQTNEPQETTDLDQTNYANLQKKYPRINVAPLKGETKKEAKIIKEYAQELGVKVANIKPGKRNTLGTYSPRSASIRIKNANDMDTILHEVGHFLDDTYGIAPEDGSMDSELERFWIYGSKPKGDNAQQKAVYRRAEAVAEWLRAFVVNPEAAKLASPQLYARYQQLVPEAVKDTIERMSNDMRTLAGASAIAKFKAKMEQTVEEAVAEDNKTFIEKAWNKMVEWYQRPSWRSTEKDLNGGGLKFSWWDKFKSQFVSRYTNLNKSTAELERWTGMYLDNTYEGIRNYMDANGVANTQANFEQQLKDRGIEPGTTTYNKMVAYHQNPTEANRKKLTQFLPNADPRILARLAASVHNKVGDMMENGIHDLAEMNDAVLEYQEVMAEMMKINQGIGVPKPSKGQQIDYIKNNYKGKDKEKLLRYVKNPKAFVNNLGKGMKRIVDTVTGEVVDFKWLIAPLPKDTTTQLGKYMDDTTVLMLAQRVVELTARGLNDGTILGLGGKLDETMSDIDWAKKAITELKEEHGTAMFAALEEAARRYRVFADGALRYMVGKGRLSQAQYDIIKAQNEQYVAMKRVYELYAGEQESNESWDIFGKNDKGQLVGNPLKKIKGSTRTLQNAYKELIKSMYATVRESDRNEATNAFVDILRDITRGLYQGQPIPAGEIAIQRELPPNWNGDLAKERMIVVFNNGEKEFWHIPDQGLYDSIIQIGKIAKVNHPLLKALTGAMRLVRLSITKFFTFAFNNFKRDVQQRFVNSRTINNATDGLKAFAQALEAILPIPLVTFFTSHKQGASNLAAVGGDQSGIFQKEMAYDQMLMRHMRTNVRANKKGVRRYILDSRILSDAWALYETFLDKIENKTRVDEYNSAFKYAKETLGYDDNNARIYAGFQARDLMDFAQSGEIGYYINQVLLFTNASIQGLARTMSSIKDNPMAFTFKALLASSLPAMLMLMLATMFDYEDDYNELPPYMRDMYYSFKTPWTGRDWLQIPKPFEVGVAGAVFERIANFYGIIGKENPYAFEGYFKSLAKGLIPIFGNDPLAALYSLSAIKPIMEVKTNWNTFRDTHVVPINEENKNINLRKTERASELGKFLANNPITNLLVGQSDPRYADHLITGYFGYFGRLAQDIGQVASGQPLKNSGKVDMTGSPAADWMLEKTGYFRGQNTFQIASYNEVQKLAKEFGLTNSSSLKALYELSDAYQGAKGEAKEKAWKQLLKSSRALRMDWEDAKTTLNVWMSANPNATNTEKTQKIKQLFR